MRLSFILSPTSKEVKKNAIIVGSIAGALAALLIYLAHIDVIDLSVSEAGPQIMCGITWVLTSIAVICIGLPLKDELHSWHEIMDSNKYTWHQSDLIKQPANPFEILLYIAQGVAPLGVVAGIIMICWGIIKGLGNLFL